MAGPKKLHTNCGWRREAVARIRPGELTKRSVISKHLGIEIMILRETSQVRFI